MRVDSRTVGRDVGRIVQAVSLMMVVSVVVAAVNREFFAVPAFLGSAVVTGGAGATLAPRVRGPGAPGGGARWAGGARPPLRSQSATHRGAKSRPAFPAVQAIHV